MVSFLFRFAINLCYEALTAKCPYGFEIGWHFSHGHPRVTKILYFVWNHLSSKLFLLHTFTGSLANTNKKALSSHPRQTICWRGWDDNACLGVRNNSIGAWPNFLVWSPLWCCIVSPLLQTNKKLQFSGSENCGINFFSIFSLILFQIWMTIFIRLSQIDQSGVLLVIQNYATDSKTNLF